MPSREHFIVVEALPPVTEHVIDGYNNAGMLLAYETFDVSGDAPEMREASKFRDEQKELFFEGAIRNPALNNCPNFQLERSERRAMYQQTTSLMQVQQLRRHDGQAITPEDRLLNNMLALRINELGFVETASLIAEGGLSKDERHEAAAILKSASREIYGMPEEGRAFSIIDKRLDKARAIANKPDHPAGDIARQVLDMIRLPEYAKSGEAISLDGEVARYYREMLQESFQEEIDAAFAEVGDKETYSVQEMAIVFQSYIDRRGFGEDGWRAEIIPNRTACATKAEDRIVEIGDKRPASSRTYDKVLDSLVHEVEIHAGRQYRGKHLGAGLAEYGLAGYTVFEEPFAATVASVCRGDAKSSGEVYSMALAIAAGYDDGVERDFRDTFESMWRLGLVNTYKDDKPLEEQVEKARKNAYGNLVRVWRGMPTDVPGCVFSKDKAYDNAEVVQYLKGEGEVLPRQDFLRLLQAKYNPLDPEQDAYIRSLTS
ncbi:MAG TPA: hypothetical protein VK978_00535 [Candidatus Saccharimonadales bacterium]|nr:hypothetical protein [Candidatus Saccharimonadales bacterium]